MAHARTLRLNSKETAQSYTALAAELGDGGPTPTRATAPRHRAKTNIKDGICKRTWCCFFLWEVITQCPS